MKKLALLLALVAGAGESRAQTPPPQQIKGFGTLSVSTSSVSLSTLTPGPGSPAWPFGPNLIYIINATGSAGTLFVCPLGGTCSSSVGIPLAAGTAYGFVAPSTNVTVISTSTSTAVAQW